ncbi:MAG: hypothetical protein BAA04_12250 [Firmicutes bacterium ZCTH02-B6]|nr:MAG: hypothetical protein BAA04_12250 [Firmicutes bacterium ZCTH02-B6]
MGMAETGYRGTAANRGAAGERGRVARQGAPAQRGTMGDRNRTADPDDGDKLRQPPTAAVGGTGRDIVRFLEGNGGEAPLSDVAAHMPDADRGELESAVEDLKEAGIVDVVAEHGEPRVRLLLPVLRNPRSEA